MSNNTIEIKKTDLKKLVEGYRVAEKYFDGLNEVEEQKKETAQQLRKKFRERLNRDC